MDSRHLPLLGFDVGGTMLVQNLPTQLLQARGKLFCDAPHPTLCVIHPLTRQVEGGGTIEREGVLGCGLGGDQQLGINEAHKGLIAV